MRNLKNIWFLLFCIFPLVSLAQEVYPTEYEIQYSIEYSIFGDNLDAKQTEVLYLFSSPQTSVFMNHNSAKADEIKKNVERMLQSGSIDMNKAGHKTSDFPLEIYKNLHEGKTIVKDKLADKNYVYQESQVPLDWNITSESKDYSGYQTQKATTSFAGRDYEAWFTMEIPLPDGPYVFSGLPGLIVELYDTQNHYHFTLLSVDKLEEPKDWELGKVEKVSKEEYREIRAKILENLKSSNPFLNQGPNATIEIRGADGREISQAEFMRDRRNTRESKNNPIELE
ncbi:MAG TPA: GLPGLI family protein [Flavobacteriaceae bacterium]|nr:GLPGLI family protein [Flavobacteriaceae bacterium]